MSGGDWKQLFNAACAGEIELVAYYCRRGVDVNYAHPEVQSTPLVAALLAGQAEVANYLLDHGAAPDLHSDFDGMRPVEAARHAGLPAVEARLLQLGVAPVPEAPPAAPSRPWWRAWAAGA